METNTTTTIVIKTETNIEENQYLKRLNRIEIQNELKLKYNHTDKEIKKTIEIFENSLKIRLKNGAKEEISLENYENKLSNLEKKVLIEKDIDIKEAIESKIKYYKNQIKLKQEAEKAKKEEQNKENQ